MFVVVTVVIILFRLVHDMVEVLFHSDMVLGVVLCSYSSVTVSALCYFIYYSRFESYYKKK